MISKRKVLIDGVTYLVKDIKNRTYMINPTKGKNESNKVIIHDIFDMVKVLWII